MRKILLIAFLFCLSPATHAVELDGVKLADTVHPGNSNLVLNGAGVRSKFIFDLYVAALYLGEKKTSAAAVLNDAGEKRIALHLLREISADHLLSAFKKAIENNHTGDELKALQASLTQFEQIFNKLGEVKKGDIITLDYQRDIGTQVAVNGVVQGTIAGFAFNAALLKIWLGDKPAQQDLKLKLLGGQ